MDIDLNKEMLQKKAKYLIAVSGGVDSMVLLDYLVKENYKIEIIHINHHTRDLENSKDLAIVTKFSKKNKINLYTYDYYHRKGNFEGKAREFRLKKYKELVDEKSFKGVILAHHKDDQIENILMNSKKKGYVLMKDNELINNVQIYRPFLKTYKKDIYAYAKKYNINYNEDYTNKFLTYRRNKYRYNLKILNELQKNTLYDKQVLKEKKLFLIANFQKSIMNNNQEFGFDSKYIMTVEELYIYLKNFNLICNLSFQKLNSILLFLNSKKNGKISIDKNNLLYLAYDKLYIINLKKKIIPKQEQSLVEGLNKFNNLEFYSNDQGIIKTYQKNDIIRYKFGKKKISRFFIDEKIPQNLRCYWPIFYNNNNEIIYIPKKREIKLLKYIGEYNNV